MQGVCRAVEIKIIEDVGKNNMHINDFDYELPQELIAQTPAQKRDCSRLMVVDRKTGEVAHKHFYDIIDELKPTDCLVLNNSKVLPARLYGTKEGTGAKEEFLLIKRIEGDVWENGRSDRANRLETGRCSDIFGSRSFFARSCRITAKMERAS